MAFLLLLCNVILRMTEKTWIEHFFNLVRCLKDLGNCQSVGTGLFHPNFERLAAAHGEPRVERVQAFAHSFDDKLDFVVHCSIIEANTASNQVRVTPDILGQGLGHDVGPKLKRVLVDGAHKGVVDAEQDTVVVANSRK